MPFKLQSKFKPAGGQPQAIKQLLQGYQQYPQQTLLGVTGSGKTFTMANIIAKVNRPTLVLSHNKTLAAQLYQEFKDFFPANKVCYFISYYDYYQPESYLPQTDTYIEKDTAINDKIEQLRLEATASLLSRDDVIIVASVSCIYGLGKPENYLQGAIELAVGQPVDRDTVVHKLVDLLYQSNDTELLPGRFRVKGNIVELIEGAGTSVLRLQFDDDRLVAMTELHPITFAKVTAVPRVIIFPAKHFIITDEEKKRALKSIRAELAAQLPQLGELERYRLAKRTNYDLEMIEQIGTCKGIENYSRHFDARQPGQPPYTLLDYFEQKGDWLFVIDESHVALPQVEGMHGGDRSRKKNLIDYGFRLPSAYDNRPLTWQEFEKYLHHVVYTSATPGDYEIRHSGQTVEQIIRPTGLVDPVITVKPADGQVKDVEKEIRQTTAQGYRVLVTTLTKRLAEDLTSYLIEQGVKAQYLHSEIDTLERTKIIQDLRRGTCDVLVGINLLREGIDLPEVALVAILDADKEGFLRNERSLIQTIGRAARNVDGRVIMYADTVTGSIKRAIAETDRRRAKQVAYNTAHGITPQSIIKAVMAREEDDLLPNLNDKATDLRQLLIELELAMQAAAEELDFERAIELREKIRDVKHKIK